MWYVWIVREKWIRGDGSAATILSYIGAMFYALHPPLPHCPSHTFLLCRCCVSSIPKTRQKNASYHQFPFIPRTHTHTCHSNHATTLSLSQYSISSTIWDHKTTHQHNQIHEHDDTYNMKQIKPIKEWYSNQYIYILWVVWVT